MDRGFFCDPVPDRQNLDTGEQEETRMGYGKCEHCDCGAFVDKTDIYTKCARSTCGHQFQDHY